MALRISAKLPSAGPAPADLGVPALARRLEDAGFDGIWCSDHVVMTERWDRSTYPFSDDGAPGWDVTTPWYDAVVVMAQAAAVTERVEIGCAVLVLPLRHPVVLAKQVASLDRLSGGRVALGVGAGWYREEFEALGLDFAARGRRMDEALTVLRDAWTGRPPAFDGAHVRVPAGVIHEPTPAHPVPVVVGGMSDAALRRAAAQDGWLALQRVSQLDPDGVADGVTRLRAAATAAGRDPAALRVVLRVIESQGRAADVAAVLPALVRAGVDEVVVDTDWTAGDEREVHDLLAAAAAA